MRALAFGFAIGIMIALIAAPQPGAQSIIGHASIRAPAVVLENNTGSLTTINLTVYSGNGTVTVGGPTIIGNSTIQSATIAAQYAATYLSLNFSKYNFNYTIFYGGDNVSGPSGGTAMTLLAVSALSGKPLLNNFSVTGTISSNGMVGVIGGVYDKAEAVKNGNLKFFIVPSAQNYSYEAELYLLVQDTFNLTLVQVANISQAYQFAFGIENPQLHVTNYTFYNNINPSTLPAAPLACSNDCNIAPFYKITNFTFGFTNSSINSLNPRFSNVAYQLHTALSEYRGLASDGYLYGGADLAFLSYINSFLFNSYKTNKELGLTTARGVENYCLSLYPPQLTSTNYEYVIGGELRQAWGEYTTNATLTIYNSTIETTDDVLEAMQTIGTANAWCNAASQMYQVAQSSGGVALVPDSNLSNVAYNRISRASEYGQGLYLNTAEDAFSVNNYPLAIIDADYAYAIANASQSAGSFTTDQLLNISDTIARNSTYGVWATQFANEAEMYIALARQTSNSSLAKSYADEAYSASLLASQVSIDTKTINDNLVTGTGTQRIGVTTPGPPPPPATNSTTTSYLIQTTYYIFVIAVVMLVVNIVLFFVVMYLLIPASKAAREQNRTNTRRRRNG